FVSLEGERAAVQKIHDILAESSFALMKDSVLGDLAGSKSIVDAAVLMREYDYDFGKWYALVMSRCNSNGHQAFRLVWSEIQEKIYGAGPRIASQFVRGMVLKGPWVLPLTDDSLLEESEYNVTFAGPHRFSLVEGKNDYRTGLSDFADKYLDGNRAIVSHVLWYIRKSVCDKQPLCFECPMAGFCTYYLKSGYSLTPLNQPTPRNARNSGGKQIAMSDFIS